MQSFLHFNKGIAWQNNKEGLFGLLCSLPSRFSLCKNETIALYKRSIKNGLRLFGAVCSREGDDEAAPLAFRTFHDQIPSMNVHDLAHE